PRGGAAVFAALNRIQLPYADGSRRAAGDFLRDAAGILVDRKAGSVWMPAAWPPVREEDARTVQAAVKAVLEARAALADPGAARFDEATGQYRVCAFARVRRPDGCPPTLVWSRYSEPFTIAAWFESGNRPPQVVPLPNVDRDFLRNLKPTVTFAVPKDLFNL